MEFISCALVVFVLIPASYQYRVVTLINPPFVQKNSDDLLEGFCVDLMNEVSVITKHRYYFYLSPSGYGFNFNGRWTGMIGELVKRSADIAIADLTINDDRKKVVDFTEPFFQSGISALMLKSHASKINSWADLANQTVIPYGILENGPTRRVFQYSSDPILQKMWNFIASNSSNFVISYTDALRKILRGNYIFIGPSSHIEYLIGRRCDLTRIESDLPHDRNYGIALPKNSPILASFNSALKKLSDTGKINELIEKWWQSRCN